jgi:exonuclease SbcD
VLEIEPLIEGAGTVIFNGDTTETRAKCFMKRGADQQAKLTGMLAGLGVKKTVYVTGNHDPCISEHHYLDLCQGKVLVTHGDFLLRYVSPWSHKLRHCRPRIDAYLAQCDQARMDTDFEYRLEVTRHCCDLLESSRSSSSRSLLSRIKYVSHEFWPPTRIFIIVQVWMRSPGLMAAALETYRPNAQVAVFGHIHYPGIWRRRGRLLVNTGGYLCAVKARVVEISDQKVITYKVARRGSECHLVKPVTVPIC